jgi:hypothetical protein
MKVPLYGVAIRSIGISVLGIVTSVSAADFGQRSSHTPYDPYLSRVFTIVGRTGVDPADPGYVREKMKEARRIRHHYDPRNPYVPQGPATTERRQVGDCKAKALWLANELNDPRVRFVVGKYTAGRVKNHAWLMWMDGSEWWVLDPTFHDRPIRFDSTSTKWVPHYSYGKHGRYVHGDARQGPNIRAQIAWTGKVRR